MGMSMLLYAAPDPDLRAFAVAHSALNAWLRLPRALPEITVHEYWRDLDVLIGRAPAAPSLSPLTAAGADWAIPQAADGGAHALLSTSTMRLLDAVGQVGREEIEAYVRERWARQAERTGQSPELTPAQIGSRAGELELYVGKLKAYCNVAVQRGYGLVIALWETP
jgi:hypothetical protein